MSDELLLKLSNHDSFCLIESLEIDDTWRRLIPVIPSRFLCSTYIPRSAKELFIALQNSLTHVSHLISWLEEIGDTNVLLLLKEDEAIVIDTQPTPNLEITESETLRLSCVARAFPPPEYQWFFNKRPLQGCQESVLEIKTVSVDHEGSYRCRVLSEGQKPVFSNPCHVHVIPMKRKSPDCLPFTVSDKVALLISNSHYEHNHELPLAEKDVVTLGKKLASLGFRILAFKDLRKEEFLRVVDLFCSFLGKNVLSVFYYAGHGFRNGELEYLTPVEASIDNDPSECVRFQEIMYKVNAKDASLNWMIVDCCRIQTPSPEPKIQFLLGGPNWDFGAPLSNHYLLLSPLSSTTQFGTQATYDPCFPLVGDPSSHFAKRNSITLYGTSPFMSAIEITGKENGVLVESLKKYITEDLPVHEIIRRVMLDIDIQAPEVQYNNPYNYKLKNEIVPCSLFSKNSQMWEQITALPPDINLKVGVINATIEMTFLCEKEVFCNSVLVRAFLKTSLSDLRIELSTRNQTVEWCCHSFSLSCCTLFVRSLQRLSSPLDLKATVTNVLTGHVLYQKEIQCGYPLISFNNVNGPNTIGL